MSNALATNSNTTGVLLAAHNKRETYQGL